MRIGKRHIRHHGSVIWEIVKIILIFILKIISFLIAILLIISGIVVWSKVGDESLLLTIFGIPLGILLLVAGWKLLRWSIGSHDNFSGRLPDDSDESW